MRMSADNYPSWAEEEGGGGFGDGGYCRKVRCTDSGAAINVAFFDLEDFGIAANATINSLVIAVGIHESGVGRLDVALSASHGETNGSNFRCA